MFINACFFSTGILTKNTSLRARSDSPHRRKSEHLRIEQHQQQQQLIQESQFSQSSSTKTFHTEQRTLSSSANQTQQVKLNIKKNKIRSYIYLDKKRIKNKSLNKLFINIISICLIYVLIF